ncbi:MAG: lipase family protein [Mycobacterium sp.]
MRRAVRWVVVPLIVVGQIVGVVLLFPYLQPSLINFLDIFPSSGGAPAHVASANLKDDGPGSLLAATTMPGVTRTFMGRDLQAARVVYRSTSGDTAAPTVVSGSVFVPEKKAPAGGWPVVAFGHGTLGIDNQCAPSLSPDLSSYIGVVGVLVKLGYAVAFPDYQGLGTKGIHPYADSKTAGFNMIDAVRALHRTYPNISNRWAAIGGSQGGGAAWAADELAAGYAPELTLIAAAATSPPTDLSGLVDKAQEGTLTMEQGAVMQAIVESLARLHPDLDRDDYRHGTAKEYWDVMSDCSDNSAYKRGEAIKRLGPHDFTPDSADATIHLRDLLQKWAIPQKPLSAPLYVWYGGQDRFIDPAWTKAGIQRACDLGGSITIDFDPNGGHNPPTGDTVLAWIADRFAGKPAANDCKSG